MNLSKEVIKLAEGYSIEDAVTHHVLYAYLNKHFNHQDLYKRHKQLAMDHASNDNNKTFTPKDVEDMIAHGKQGFGFNDGEKEEDPYGFKRYKDDKEVGQ